MAEISIICTVKNAETTIGDMIDSVLSQTMKEWEFIIVDDGSTDNTPDILNHYMRIDDRIKIILTDGIGRGKALNLAIKKSSGNYIANIDADDLMHISRMEIQYQIMQENKDIFLLSTMYEIIYDHQEVQWEDIRMNNIRLIDSNKKILIKNIINHSSVIMNTKKLKSIGCYDEKRKNNFDYELWLRSNSEGYRMATLNLKLVAKRLHENQSFENKNRKDYLKESTRLQMKFILKARKFGYILLPSFRYVYGLLPIKVRKYLF